MSLTQSQRAWAQEQVGTKVERVVSGVVVNNDGEKGNYKLDIDGPDGKASFELVNADPDFVEEHMGKESSVRVTGNVESVILDEENGRVGLVGDGFTVWQTPDTDQEEEEAVEIEEQNRPPMPTPAPFVWRNNVREGLLDLLENDAEFKAKVKEMLA